MNKAVDMAASLISPIMFGRGHRCKSVLLLAMTYQIATKESFTSQTNGSPDRVTYRVAGTRLVGEI